MEKEEKKMTKQEMKKWLENQIKFNEEQVKKLEELGENEKANFWRGKANAEKEILRCCY